jgi:hypothetical protein
VTHPARWAGIAGGARLDDALSMHRVPEDVHGGGLGDRDAVRVQRGVPGRA